MGDMIIALEFGCRYGESENKLAQIFEACNEMGGAIIFIDEVRYPWPNLRFYGMGYILKLQLDLWRSNGPAICLYYRMESV